MADVRINGRRFPALQAIDNMGIVLSRLESLGQKNNTVLTAMSVNGRPLDLDANGISRLKLDRDDTLEARMESPEQLSFESLQVAQEMAELLLFDIKVATLHLWDNSHLQEKSLETLLNDCKLFLTLGARPIDLLGKKLEDLPLAAEACLRHLDFIAGHLQDTVLLAVHGKLRDACHVLVARLMPALEKWLGHTAGFAETLAIDRVELPIFLVEAQNSEKSPSSLTR